MSGDLLNKLGSKPNSVEGAGKAPEPRQPAASTVSSAGEFDRGDDLLAKATVKAPGAAAPAAATQASSAESGQSPKSASSTEEPTGGQTNSDDWTQSSAIKEVKKLREENKAYRIKYQEQLEKLKVESDVRISQKEEEMKALLDAKKELDRLKAEQEDKKRDLSEKLAHREARIAEVQTTMEARERQWQEQLRSYELKVNQYEADRQAEAEVYKSRLNEELAKVPGKFREYADLLVKGAGDSRDALIALSEAKIKGMFEDRTVIVNHSVPGAADGARASKERLEEADKSRRAKMTSTQKIGEALKGIKQGTPNSAFRNK